MFRSKGMNSQGGYLQVESGTPGTPAVITAITKANPGVFTSTKHGLTDGQVVTIAAVVGMTEVNNVTGIVDVTDVDTFHIVGLDTSAFTAYVSGGTATPNAYLACQEAKTFNGFDGQAAEVDITTMMSEAKEYVPGLQDFGAFNISMNYVPDDAATLAMQAAKKAGAKKWFELVLPGSKGRWVFLGFVRQMTISGGVDTAMNTNAVLRITGEPTYVAGT